MAEQQQIEEALARAEASGEAWTLVAVASPPPGEPPYRRALNITGVSLILGVAPSTVVQFRSWTRAGRLPAGTPPFPPEEVPGSRPPYWFPERAGEFLDWQAARPGRGAGGGKGKHQPAGAVPSWEVLVDSGLEALERLQLSRGGEWEQSDDFLREGVEAIVGARLERVEGDKRAWAKAVAAGTQAMRQLHGERARWRPEGWVETRAMRREEVKLVLATAVRQLGVPVTPKGVAQFADLLQREKPKFARIADALRARIEAGELRPGDRLPSVAALAAEHGVSSTTVQQALVFLRGQGEIVSSRGRGNFVAGAETLAPDRE